MNDRGEIPIETRPVTGKSPDLRGALFRKYILLFVGVLCLALFANGLFEVWSTYQDHMNSQHRIQREQANAAAAKIGQFIKEIEGQIGWTTQLEWSADILGQRRAEARRLLRQVPAITELAEVNAEGREWLHVSRLAMDVIGAGADLSHDPKFLEAMSHKVYYGPVYFRRESEPYMTLALGGTRREAGVTIAEVNLKFIWDVVSQIKVGATGVAYIVDAGGRLISHPDISLVLRNTDLSRLSQVQVARNGGTGIPSDQWQFGEDVRGQQVIAAYSVIAPLGWLMFVELPLAEAYAPVYASLYATGLVLLAALLMSAILSLVLVRRMVRPIQTLQTGAARIGAGALDHRIDIATGDELEALGNQFNSMAAQLQQSYATLERKVDERTHQLQLANLAKSRFIAAASHDLRQPLHALGLFVAQLRSDLGATERSKIISRVDSAVAAMNELFNALLDISKLDAEVLAPNVTEFPIEQLFKRLETTFAHAARENGLRLRIMSSNAWVRSDAILLERVMLNLVSNAVRYTRHGGVIIGCRRRGTLLRLEVWDSGIGIPENQRQNIFGEFFQIVATEGEQRAGLGLGLAIVDRLCHLLGHPIEVTSTVGKGSRFSVTVPLATTRAEAIMPSTLIPIVDEPCKGKLIVVIDDDALVLDGMSGLLASWGCRVVTAKSESAASAILGDQGQHPDLVISDYQLTGGNSGIEAIGRLRRKYASPIPAFLISGDTAPERLREARAGGYQLLHKPVSPMQLRAILNQFLRKQSRPEHVRNAKM